VREREPNTGKSDNKDSKCIALEVNAEKTKCVGVGVRACVGVRERERTEYRKK